MLTAVLFVVVSHVDIVFFVHAFQLVHFSLATVVMRMQRGCGSGAHARADPFGCACDAHVSWGVGSGGRFGGRGVGNVVRVVGVA